MAPRHGFEPGFAVEDARSKGGRFRVRLDKAMYGSINGGGPEMQFITFSGRIFIRQKK